MEERLPCMQEVAGSIPAFSTRKLERKSMEAFHEYECERCRQGISKQRKVIRKLKRGKKKMKGNWCEACAKQINGDAIYWVHIK